MKFRNILSLLFVFPIIALIGQTKLEIFQIQGNITSSPFVDQTVQIDENIVTAVGNGYFYVQTPDSKKDNDSETSNGILVYDDKNVQIGDYLNIIGIVKEINDETAINATSVVKIGNSQPLPQSTIIGVNFPDKNSDELESVEGMLIHTTSGFINEAINEQGFGKMNVKGKRSFRDAGSEYSLGNGIPVWDNNKEDFYLSLNNLKTQFDHNISAGTIFTSTGVISNYDGTYYLLPTEFEINSTIKWTSLPKRKDNEFTIGSINALLLFDNANNLNFRISKLAKYISEVLNNPDIIALQEVGTITTLNKLIKELKRLHPNIQYRPFIEGNSGIFNTAYLVGDRITEVSVRQLAENESVSFGGRLHHRPPLLLEGKIKTASKQSIAVMNLHLKSFLGISSGSETPIRRQEQAISVAKIVRSLQLQKKNIIIVGDFNAYPFTDGYTDPVNQISGTPSLGAKYPTKDMKIDPPLTNQTFLANINDQYSYIYRGTSQVIDHCLTGALDGFEVSRFHFAHGNSDFNKELLYSNQPFRSSDHDGFVLYLNMFETVDAQSVQNNSNLPLLPSLVKKGTSFQFKAPILKDTKLNLFSSVGHFLTSITIYEGSTNFSFQFCNHLSSGLYFYTLENEYEFKSGKLIFTNY